MQFSFIHSTKGAKDLKERPERKQIIAIRALKQRGCETEDNQVGGGGLYSEQKAVVFSLRPK
jgi:hypothetical protein